MGTGETTPEALYQPYSVRELYLTGCPGCAGKCYAKFVALGTLREQTFLTLSYQTSTQRAILVLDTMAATSSLTKLRDCASNVPLRRLAWTLRNGA
jgi:hypothetical protein